MVQAELVFARATIGVLLASCVRDDRAGACGRAAAGGVADAAASFAVAVAVKYPPKREDEIGGVGGHDVCDVGGEGIDG